MTGCLFRVTRSDPRGVVCRLRTGDYRPGRLAGPATVFLFACACTPAIPALSGGRTTPAERIEMAAGAATRVPLGSLGSTDPAVDEPAGRAIDLRGFTRRGGVAPLAWVSLPLAEQTDLGVRLAGSALMLALRQGFYLEENTQLVGGLSVYGGAVLLEDQAGQSAIGPRLGADTVWVLALDVNGIFEAWAGARAGVEHARCALEADRSRVRLRGTLLRLGPLLGLGLGFRRFHVLMELGADREWWWMLGDLEPERQAGFSLTPALALRLRL